MSRPPKKCDHTPYVDVSGIGFSHYDYEYWTWRARTIAGVSWHSVEKRAVFFNADGLALPVEASPRYLPDLLRRAVAVRFGCVEGSGQYALPAAELKSIRGGASLAGWVTYRLRLPDCFGNDRAFYSKRVAADLASGRSFWLNDSTARSQMAIRLAGELGVAPDEAQVQEALQKQADENAISEEARLWEFYEREVACDRRVAAWLAGGVEGAVDDLFAGREVQS